MPVFSVEGLLESHGQGARFHQEVRICWPDPDIDQSDSGLDGALMLEQPTTLRY
jgi:hypothetical protein